LEVRFQRDIIAIHSVHHSHDVAAYLQLACLQSYLLDLSNWKSKPSHQIV